MLIDRKSIVTSSSCFDTDIYFKNISLYSGLSQTDLFDISKSKELVFEQFLKVDIFFKLI